MVFKCTKCDKPLEVGHPHKRVGTDTLCPDCLKELDDNKDFSSKLKAFFRVKKEKVIITIILFVSMLVYNLIMFRPYLTNHKVIETIVQLGFIINYPILIVAENLNLTDPLAIMTLNTLSTVFVLLWNYLLACELYYLYKTMIKK